MALITGCSTGIGRATAMTLGATGYQVVATARDAETLQDIGAGMALRLGVTDEDSTAAAVRAVLDRYGRIDVLVNNAAFAMRGVVEELDVAGGLDSLHCEQPIARGPDALTGVGTVSADPAQ